MESSNRVKQNPRYCEDVKLELMVNKHGGSVIETGSWAWIDENSVETTSTRVWRGHS